MSKPPATILSNVTRMPALGKSVPTNAALESFNLLVQAHRDYKQTLEVERTKRALSADWRDVSIARLENQREFLQTYLKETFAERRHSIDEMFKVLDKGIADGNAEIINGAMNSIVGIVQSSPLKEAEKLIQAMNDPAVKHIEF